MLSQKKENAFEFAVKIGKVEVAAYLYNLQFSNGDKHDTSENSGNRCSWGGERPSGLLHHIAKNSQHADMATWLLSIGYRMDEEDQVIEIESSIPTYYRSGATHTSTFLLLCCW